MTKKYSDSEKKDKKAALKEITEQLEKSIHEFMNGEKYKNFLNQMSKFHSYSLNNQILIAIQRPEATICASYSGWKSQGRQVKAGEHGIKILCPAFYKKEKIKDVIDPTTEKPVLLPDGNVKREIVEVIIPHFKIGHTFDISQTEGKPLVELSQQLTGELTDSQKELKVALLQISPVPVSFQPIEGSTNGFYSLDKNEITVDSNLSEKQSIKTLIHEIAHATIHNTNIPDAPKDSPTREVQAESIAYVVCQYFGMDVSDYSFGYIAGWSTGKDTKELQESLEIIRDTSNDIISKTEQTLTQMQSIEQTVSETIQPKRRGRCM